ncbi:MAG: hypothetical protein LBD13_04360, partial [Spirochaetaceae bacterium]|nr:hypothetical protein [Spirochaetaceae bacterium]
MTLQILLKEARSADNFLYFLYINRARQEAFRGGTEGSRRLFPYGKFAKFAKEAANNEALIKKPSKFMRDESEMSVLEPKMSVFESEMSVFESEMSVFESEMSVLEPKMSVFDSEMSVLDSEM